MANAGKPNSGGCQFFIVVADTPSLDGGYSLFGRVLEGNGDGRSDRRRGAALQLGNPDLARFIGVLERGAADAGAESPSPEAPDNYKAMGASDAQAAVANEIAHQVYDASWKSAAYLAANSGEPDPETVVRICQEFQSFFVYVLWFRMLSEDDEQASGRFCAMLASFGTEYLQRVAERTVGGTLPEKINAEEFQEAFTEYYSSPSDLPVDELCGRILACSGIDRSTSIENLVLHVLQRGEFEGFKGLEIPIINVGDFVSRYLAA